MAAPVLGCAASSVPYRPGRYGLKWDGTIKTLSSYGDNWPATTLPDGSVFTSYGDGSGFAGHATLSLGFATVTGKPWGTMSGVNQPSNLDLAGHGSTAGYKASGLLASGGMLYCLVRNYIVNGDYRHARLASSADGGKTWAWASWYFSGTFGCPDFVQGAPDDGYAYLVSQDNDDAYEWCKRIVLARVPLRSVIDRATYEFRTASGWSADINARSAIVADRRSVLRVSMSYNQAISRYILVTPHQTRSAGFNGSLGVFCAPDPWGPWRTMYYSDTWSPPISYEQKFPPAYQSGMDLWCVFSGQTKRVPYKFTLRRAVITPRSAHR